jgi:hypothetical protein
VQVTRLERVHEDEALQEEAEALFKEMDTDGACSRAKRELRR